MSNREIIAEFKSRYPIGCKYKPIDKDGTSYHQDLSLAILNHNNITVGSKDEAWLGSDAGYIRSTCGRWAEIVSLPEGVEQVTNQEYILI